MDCVTVTIVPTPCRKELGYSHQRGPEADRRVRCSDYYRWSTGVDPEPRICALCVPLGRQLAYAGYSALGEEFGPSWESCLAWNLTLGALCCAAAERARLEAYDDARARSWE
jgi:hypothetical protein